MSTKKILAIEDDPVMLKILQSFLPPDFELLVAIDPEEGLGKAESGHPDLILLDMVLPRISGKEVLKTLKAGEKTRSIPVLVFSVMGREDTIKETLELGAADYIVKGMVSLPDLAERIKRLLA